MEIRDPDKASDATTVNVICMKWGHVYGPKYVNNLYAGVTRHLVPGSALSTSAEW